MSLDNALLILGMISMSQTYSIRQLRKSGESISEIARKVGVSRNTVYAKLAAPTCRRRCR